MSLGLQKSLFPDLLIERPSNRASSSTFADNLRLPCHRWFKFSAGFSAQWVDSVIGQVKQAGDVRLLDPFAGCGTTVLVAEEAHVKAIGLEAHPFLVRVGQAKLRRGSDPNRFRQLAREVRAAAKHQTASTEHYPALIHKCYHRPALEQLDSLRRAIESARDDSPEWELVWLALVSSLRASSYVNTAQWQYILPNKTKKNVVDPLDSFDLRVSMFFRDMLGFADIPQDVRGEIVNCDARTCDIVPDGFATLVVTSPPYPNNYDYADATRLEMCFLGEICGWSDLQAKVRRHLVRACSQHVPQRAVDLDRTLAASELEPIRKEITDVCAQLQEIRKTKGGKKTYHLMVACYFLDLARVWRSLRRVCDTPSRLCFVVGDSAPYGVYVPVFKWLTSLAEAAGFGACHFEKTRDRNIKWKNRKHRVPLSEGRLWVEG